MSLCLVVFLAGLATYGIRLSFIVAHGRIETPPWFVRGLAFVPVAILSALVVPDLVTLRGSPTLSPANPRLLAGAVAVLLAWKTRSTWLTIAVGMASLWALQRILGGSTP